MSGLFDEWWEPEPVEDRPDPSEYMDEDAVPGERFGFGVCRRGTCVEPCGPNGGCVR